MTSRQVGQVFFSFVLAIFVDQTSKYFAHDVVLNAGVSFGLFPSSILTVLLLGVLIAIALKFGKLFYESNPLLTGIFFGGSISNIIDRIVYGGVRDFLYVPVFDIRNNLADWAIIISLMWLFFKAGKPAHSTTV